MAWWMVAFGAFSGYVGTSLFLFRFPTLLHRKKNSKLNCIHISHRGGAGERLENTMSALCHAVDDCKTDMLELDCQMTADGHVVVAHDDHLERMAGVSGVILDHKFEDLPDLKITNSGDDQKDVRIPSLRQVFAHFPGLPINVDVKNGHQDLIDKVGDLIVEFGREGITPWGSWNDSVCRKCHLKNPDIPLFFSMKRVALTLFLFYTGLLPFFPLKESCFEVFMPGSDVEQLKALPLERRVFAATANFFLIRPSLFRHLQKRGIRIYLWVLNNDVDYQRAFDYGVDGVMTDYPTKLRHFINNNQLSPVGK